MSQQSKITVLGVVLVVFFTVYYALLSEMLPRGSGPDELAHLKAAEFIYLYKRLPVYPADREALHYSKHGATRSFRPPLVYIASALIQGLNEYIGFDFDQPHRKANAVIGALCALFLFLALYAYTGSSGLAVLLSVAFALMPQVSFVFSYLNSDGAGYMAASLVLLSLSILLKRGITVGSAALFGIACGVLSLTKITAWVFCFPVCLFALVFIMRSRPGVTKPILVLLLAFALTGGWRIAHNIYQHGVNNPFNWQIEAELREQYKTVQPEDVKTYSALGKSYLDLLTNYDNFLSRTYLSFVGHLDWLRLKVGFIQYSAYALVIALGLLGWLYVLFKPVFDPGYARADRQFEASIIVGCLLLIFAYMYFNINNEIQIQGKYVLPALPGHLLILAAFLKYLFWDRFNLVYRESTKKIILWFFLVSLAYVHTQALYKFVVPFYFSGAYVDKSGDRFTPIPFTSLERLRTGDLELLDRDDEAITFRVTGPDPRVTIKDVRINVVPELILLRIQVVTSKPGYYDFYWDAGTGMSERTAVTGFVPADESTIYQILPLHSIGHVRFDHGSLGDTFTIKDLAYSPLKYNAPYSLLNKIFRVRPTEDSLKLRNIAPN